MKYLLSLLLVALFLSCKQEPKIPVEPEPQLTILDSIGMVYGYPNWSKVNSIHFTFNVVGDPGYKRSWKWDVRKQEVTSVIEEDTVTYLRRAVDSTVAEVDARFINDKYWLLVPFNLVWDQENFTYSIEDEVKAPISQLPHKKLTIVYGDTGGYTPGDAYDFYLSKNLEIKEWGSWEIGAVTSSSMLYVKFS